MLKYRHLLHCLSFRPRLILANVAMILPILRSRLGDREIVCTSASVSRRGMEWRREWGGEGLSSCGSGETKREHESEHEYKYRWEHEHKSDHE